MNSNDISQSLNNWKVLKLVCVQNKLSKFSLGMVGRIDNFKDTDEYLFLSFLLIHLIWESGINNNSIEVWFILECIIA